MKLFGPHSTKWRPKIFAGLTKNHLLIVNFFQLYKYQIFGLIKMFNMRKLLFQFTINGPSKMLIFVYFCLFCKFQMTIVKDFMKNHIIHFCNGFGRFHEVLLCHKYFWSTDFWQWNSSLFKLFDTWTEIIFCFFFFLNENVIRTSLLMR